MLTLWAISPRLAGVVVACHVAFTLAIYALLDPPKTVGVGTLFGPVNTLLAWASVLSAGAFLLVLRYAWKEDAACVGEPAVASRDTAVIENR